MTSSQEEVRTTFSILGRTTFSILGGDASCCQKSSSIRCQAWINMSKDGCGDTSPNPRQGSVSPPPLGIRQRHAKKAQRYGSVPKSNSTLSRATPPPTPPPFSSLDHHRHRHPRRRLVTGFRGPDRQPHEADTPDCHALYCRHHRTALHRPGGAGTGLETRVDFSKTPSLTHPS